MLVLRYVRIPVTILRRHSNDGFASEEVASMSGDDDYQSREKIESCDPRQILLTLFEFLKSYSEKIRKTVDNSCSCDDFESGSTGNIDYCECNNLNYRSKAEDSNLVTSFTRNNEKNKTRAILFEKLKTGVDRTRTLKENSYKGQPNLIHKFTETACCTCDSNHRCLASSDCGYGCCTPETDHELILFDKINPPFSSKRQIVKPKIGEIGSSIRKVFDSIYMGSDYNYCCTPECYEHQNETKPLIAGGELKIDQSPKVMSQAVYNMKSSCKSEKNDSNCETECRTATECSDTSAFCETSAFPLLITKGQGLVEIHILALQLSTKVVQTLSKNESNDLSIFISWDVWNQETAFTPIMKYPSLTFNSSSVYRVCELENFFESVLREHIVFQVHAVDRDEETFAVAKAKLSVKDILDYPQNKLHYITPVFSVIPCTCDGNFGQLSLWIRLSCDIDLVENFKDRHGLTTDVSKDQKIQILAQQEKQENKSSPVLAKNFLPMNSSLSSNNSYPIPELTSAPVRDISPDMPERPKTAAGYFPKVQTNRLDTIRETGRSPYSHQAFATTFFTPTLLGAESEHRAESGEKVVKKGKYRYEKGEQVWSDVVKNTSLTPSILTMENDSQESDVGNDGTSEDTISQDSQKKVESGEQVESGSITEFNNVLKNQIDGSSLHGTESVVDDLGKVIADDKWEEYKRNSINRRTSTSLQEKSYDANLGNVKDSFRDKNVPMEKETITISIVAMSLFDKTSIMNNPDVDLLYVEYSFLGMRGADMETVSLPKPKNKNEKMVFNFTRRFQIDEEYHNSQRNMLIAMLSGTASPIIRFVIVNEPLPEEMDTKECVEVGHADLNIREYALGDGLRDVPLIIMNPSQSEQLGMLKITIDGIEIIRNCMMVQKRF